MSYAPLNKFTPQSTPLSTSLANQAGVLDDHAPIFFAHIAKQVGRKPFYLGLRVSKTLVDMWCSGDKRDVFTAAKQACEIVREERRADLIPSILEYISGGFDGAVLNAEQVEALKIISKAVR